jgi:hypothetical protein
MFLLDLIVSTKSVEKFLKFPKFWQKTVVDQFQNQYLLKVSLRTNLLEKNI